jgi:hypothetical protein
MISRWRSESEWAARLRTDEAMLHTRASAAQAAAIRRIVSVADDGKLDFLVVYGSVSRGQQRVDSDLDVYYETSERSGEIGPADPESPWHVFGVAGGALLESLRDGDGFAFDLVADALVVCDHGPFRDVAIALDEERLSAASGSW